MLIAAKYMARIESGPFSSANLSVYVLTEGHRHSAMSSKSGLVEVCKKSSQFYCQELSNRSHEAFDKPNDCPLATAGTN